MFIIKYLYQTRLGDYQWYTPRYYFDSEEEAQNVANEIWEQTVDNDAILTESIIVKCYKYH